MTMKANEGDAQLFIAISIYECLNTQVSPLLQYPCAKYLQGTSFLEALDDLSDG